MKTTGSLMLTTTSLEKTTSVWRRSCSYFSCATERGDGKEREDGRDDHGQRDQPVSGVAGPGAEGVVEPGEGEDGEDGAGHLVEELFEGAPEATEAAWWYGNGGGCCGGCAGCSGDRSGHGGSVA